MKEVDVLASFARQMSLADRVIARKKRSDSSRVLYRERAYHYSPLMERHAYVGRVNTFSITRLALYIA